MATSIQTKEVKIVIDPAVALAPKRFDLPPHQIEKAKKEELWGKVKNESADAKILILTHYHFDHFDPKEPEIYTSKRVLLKNPKRVINKSQKKRAALFISSLKNLVKGFSYADNKKFVFFLG